MLQSVEAQLKSTDIRNIVARLQQVASVYVPPLEHMRRDVSKVGV